MRKINLLFALLLVFSSSSVTAGYSNFYNVEWLRTAEGGWIGFRNKEGTVLGDSACPGAIEVRWTIASNTDYYKRVLSILMTAKSTGSQVRWWQCGCSDDGSLIKACDIEFR